MSSELKDKDVSEVCELTHAWQQAAMTPTLLHPTINRSKHICFCVQQPHIYNCKLALIAQRDSSDAKQFGHRRC